MKNEKIYDVLIVGAGPSGSNTAISFKNLDTNLNIGLIDKAIFPRDKICGDALSGKSVRIMEELNLISEVEKLNGSEINRITFGAEAYPIGVLIATYYFLPLDKTAFIYGILIGGFSDSMASVIGKYYGYREIVVFGQKKSLGGSLSFFITTVIISYSIIFILGIEMNIMSILIIAFILTIAELVQTFGLDNVTIPVLGGMALNYFRLINLLLQFWNNRIAHLRC